MLPVRGGGCRRRQSSWKGVRTVVGPSRAAIPLILLGAMFLWVFWSSLRDNGDPTRDEAGGLLRRGPGSPRIYFLAVLLAGGVSLVVGGLVPVT